MTKPQKEGQPQQSVKVLEPVEMSTEAVGPAVSSLQSVLQATGYYERAIDGYYGAETAQAVARLQRYFGITATGIYDTETWYALSFWLSEEQGWEIYSAAASFNPFRALWRLLSLLSRPEVGQDNSTALVLEVSRPTVARDIR